MIEDECTPCDLRRANERQARKIGEVCRLNEQLTAERDHLREQLREYDQTHMALPLDADGVPIRVGDTVEFVNRDEERYVREVVAVSSTEFAWESVDTDDMGLRGIARFHIHAKPRTLEDVLRELAETVRDSDGFNDACIDAAADEIRELMGADE